MVGSIDMKRMMFTIALCALAFAAVAGDSPVAQKSYQIRNCKFDQLLRPRDANNADGTHIVLYPAQPWKCMTWKLLPAGDSAFQLQNHFTHKTFEAKTDDKSHALVQIPFGRDAAKRPTWKFEKLSDGFYRAIDVASGQCRTATSEEVVILAAPDDRREQEWELIEIDPAKLTM
jgi:hypothetical protein